MKSKVISPKHVTFSDACKIVLEGEKISILSAFGVSEDCYQTMVFDFESQQQLRPTKERACFYCILSFSDSENASDELLEEIGEKFLDHIGIENTQYAIIKRIEGADLSVHLIANMVDFYGKVIKDSFIWIKGEKAARQLTKVYFLPQQQNA